MRATLLALVLIPAAVLAMAPMAMPAPGQIHADFARFLTNPPNQLFQEQGQKFATGNLPIATSFPRMTDAIDFHAMAASASASASADGVKDTGPSGASTQCEAAIQALFTTFTTGNCATTFSGVNALFNPPAGIQTNYTEQGIRLAAYCNGACRTSANAAIATVVSSCTPFEIDLFEAYSLLQHPNAVAAAFRLRALLWAINLPCVRDSDTNPTKYCLLDFIKLGNLVNGRGGNNGGYTGADLDPAQGGVCSLCTVRFYAFLTAFSPRPQLLLWRPIFLICLKDLSYDNSNPPVLVVTYCVPELAAVNSEPTFDAKFSRICRTRCFQKIITAAFALGLADANNATAVAEATKAMAGMDSLCIKNPNGELCFPKVLNGVTAIAGMFAQPPQGGGCFQQNNLCSDTCKAYINTNFVTPMGCCWNSFLAVAARYGEAAPSASTSVTVGSSGSNPSDPYAFNKLLSTYCGINMPDRCPRPAKQVRVTLRLANIAWAWIVASADNYARFRQAVRADMAAFFGAAIDDTDASATSVSGATTLNRMSMIIPSRRSASGFRTLTVDSNAGTVASVDLRFDSDNAVASANGAAAAAIADGTLDMSNTASLPTAAKQDPTGSSGVGLDASASSAAQGTATYDGSPASAVAPAVSSLLVLLFAIVAFLF